MTQPTTRTATNADMAQNTLQGCDSNMRAIKGVAYALLAVADAIDRASVNYDTTARSLHHTH